MCSTDFDLLVNTDANGGTTVATPASSPAEPPEDYSDEVPDSDIPSGNNKN